MAANRPCFILSFKIRRKAAPDAVLEGECRAGRAAALPRFLRLQIECNKVKPAPAEPHASTNNAARGGGRPRVYIWLNGLWVDPGEIRCAVISMNFTG
jgi:hypothetical protein